MNTEILKKINSFSKVELSEIKVDLALKDELVNADNKFTARILELRDQVNNADQYIRNAINARQEAQKAFEIFSDVVLKFRSATKDLGIDFPYETEYKDAQKKFVDTNSQFLKVIGNK